MSPASSVPGSVHPASRILPLGAIVISSNITPSTSHVDGAVHAERRVERAVGQVSQQPGGRRTVRVVGAGVQQHEDTPVRLTARSCGGEDCRSRHASVAANAGSTAPIGAPARAGAAVSRSRRAAERQPGGRGQGHAV